MSVAVVGCGLIGASWAALFAAAGHEVAAWDPNRLARESFEGKVGHARDQLAVLGRDMDGRVRICNDLDTAIEGASWIQENAPEHQELKRQLYLNIGRALAPEAIVATSTSSFTWSQLVTSLSYASRFVVAHPFNPPHLIPLVELFTPDSHTLSRAVAFYRAMGRQPVCMKREAVGHIGNRLASALWREAVNIVAEGIADVADVDNVLIHGPGLRWSVIGTHMGYHLGGGDGGIEHYLRHLGASQERRWASLGNPHLTPEVCDLLVAGVHAEAAGRSIQELEAERDAQLIEMLRARNAHSSGSEPGFDGTIEEIQEEIDSVLKDYFAALYHGDTAQLRNIFHPQAQLFGDVQGVRHENSLEGFINAVTQRESPYRSGARCRMERVGIEVMQEVAYVKVLCLLQDSNYQDYLVMARENGRWLIKHKVFIPVEDQA